MINRRTFLGALGSGLAATSFGWADSPKPKRLAIVSTVWHYGSHAWHMGERFLVGYPINGKWHHPPLKVVSAYVDQMPDNDLSRSRARDFGFQIYPTVAETLRCGGDQLAVDAVLVIGEHGNYPANELGQTLYPRYEFFKEIVEVFESDGRAVPMFNDKHLSWNWPWAKQMVETSRAMGFAYMAGSSLPVTWRMPSIDLPYGAEVEEVMCVAYGSVESYGIHALETIQCMAERRRGGESGVRWMEALSGEALWAAMNASSWQDGGWDPKLLHACLCRSQTLTQPKTFGHRLPTTPQMQEWVEDPVALRFEYQDGLKATMLIMNKLVRDFTFAARLRGRSGAGSGDRSEFLSTLFYLPAMPNVVYSAALMSKVEQMFLTGKAPYPIDRTLLTTGLAAAAAEARAKEGRRIETPHLAVRYHAPEESQFWRT